jgi:hypothetical protein
MAGSEEDRQVLGTLFTSELLVCHIGGRSVQAGADTTARQRNVQCSISVRIDRIRRHAEI